MYEPGYYLFEGNTLEYDGYTVYDLDSNAYYPIIVLDMAEFVRPLD